MKRLVPWIAAIIALLTFLFAAALIVYKVDGLAEGQRDMRDDLKKLTDPVSGVMNRLTSLSKDLEADGKLTRSEHKGFEFTLADHEARLRAIEHRRLANVRVGGM